MAEINITPLTDVLLVLLIIFMVSATFITQSALNVKLPEAKNTATMPSSAILVTIKTDKIIVGNLEVKEELLQSVLDNEAQKTTGRRVIIQADTNIPYGKVIKVIDKLKQAGFSSIALATQPVANEIKTP